MITDDYSYGMEAAGAGGSLYKLFLQEKNQYLNWNGRNVVHFLLRVFLSLPVGIFKFANSLAFLALTLLMCLCIRGRKKYDWPLLLSATTGIWLFGVDFGDTILWETGACNYLWGTVIILAFMVLAERLSERISEDEKGALFAAKAAGIFLFGVIAGWCNENTSGGALLFVLSLLIPFGRKKLNRKAFFVTCAAAAGNFAGLLLMVTAPGNSARASLSDEAYSGILRYVARFQKITLHVRDYFLILLCILIVFAVLRVLQLLTKGRGAADILQGLYRPALFSFLFLATSYALILTRPTQPRAFFGAGIFLLTALLQCIRDAVNEERGEAFEGNEETGGGSAVYTARLLAVSLLGIWTLVFVFTFMENAANLQRLYRDENNRIAYLLEMKEAGSQDVTIPKLRPEFFSRFSSLTQESDLDENPTYWINVFYESYYGVNCISAIPYEEWEEEMGKQQ